MNYEPFIIEHPQQNVVINVPADVTEVGLKVSGGADSSLLAYIVAMYKKNYRPDINIHPITNVVAGKEYQEIFSNRVLEKVESMVGIKFCNRYVNPVSSENCNEDQVKFTNYLIFNKKVQVNFVGETKNPPLKMDTYWEAPTGRDGIDMPTIEHRAHKPFKNINKRGIYELYVKLGVLEDIFPLTRSCEEFTSDFSKHCEICWFCKERFWGFGRYV